MTYKKVLMTLFLLVSLMPFVLSVNYPVPFVQSNQNSTAIVYGSEANSQPIASTITSAQYDNLVGSRIIVEDKKELWSKQEICRFTKGCFEESGNNCFPFGYSKPI